MKPLSEAQIAALEKGRRALAAKLAGGDPPAPISKEKPPVTKAKPSRVQHVTVGGKSKAKRTTTKATSTRTPRTTTAAKETTSGRGLLDRFGDWLSST